ncbi:hypothetical protein GCK72_023770 [Caenorhabditis remanei]|uniref:PAN-3 domain-containing protein n=1 Tax=Caenorhabditis remanei TaxID=31234 RepID=A0A6A5FXB8_CAERE|nr:hypothetical protein GCK72_023770 [Caenorhabditis remanei]KAF1747308.1 hypothetical protein GCK72_023770 [Caenorhabditis remanei]
MSIRIKTFFIVLVLVIGASQADNGCVQQENCTLTVDDPGINTKSCKGFTMHECDCVQRRSIHFEFDCYCCKTQTRERRNVPLEAMFGLKTYVLPTDPPTERIGTTLIRTTTTGHPTTQKSVIQFQKLRKAENDCGKLEFASSMTYKASVETSMDIISLKTVRATHATTPINCWNLCRYNILSGNETCTAVGFIEENAQTFKNDCYILSESPINSTGSDISVDIYEVCI